MARQMYIYTLDILEKVSFDVDLFTNELKKAIKTLLPHEVTELKVWFNQFVFINPHLEPARVVVKNRCIFR